MTRAIVPTEMEPSAHRAAALLDPTVNTNGDVAESYRKLYSQVITRPI